MVEKYFELKFLIITEFQIYSLQSDWESASENEDSVSSNVGAQLEQISKEHIYQAYRKSLDKYQKYRGRYTELVCRYRELEKDNAKARQVLVETQDKALRRISELREQCQLEQQAKAHLESALRLEMDDLQCVVKTLKTKLELMGENPDNVLNGSVNEQMVAKEEHSLINLSSDANTSNEHVDLISRLETEIKELKEKLEASQNEISEMKQHEEESNISMAQNKLMIHSELENKESEVKKLRDMVTEIEANSMVTSKELKNIKEELNQKNQELKNVCNDKMKLEERLKEVFDEKKNANNDLKELKDKLEKVYF